MSWKIPDYTRWIPILRNSLLSSNAYFSCNSISQKSFETLIYEVLLNVTKFHHFFSEMDQKWALNNSRTLRRIGLLPGGTNIASHGNLSIVQYKHLWKFITFMKMITVFFFLFFCSYLLSLLLFGGRGGWLQLKTPRVIFGLFANSLAEIRVDFIKMTCYDKN